MPVPTVPRVCQHTGCGKGYLALVKQKKRKYCSIECAWAAKEGKAKPFRLGPSPYEPRGCAHSLCSKSFTPQIPEQIYCSKPCLKTDGRKKDYGRECANCERRDDVWRSVDGVQRCNACNQHWKIYGTERPTVRILGSRAKRSGLKLCFRCLGMKRTGKFFTRRLPGGLGASPYCKPCILDYRRQWRHAHPDRIRGWSAQWAASEAGRRSRRRSGQRRRARLREAFVEDIDPFEIFERDNWICQLCKKRVNKKLRFPHPKSATLDHTIPLICGGTHERSNVKLAHFGCNASKGGRGLAEGEQLLLFG